MVFGNDNVCDVASSCQMHVLHTTYDMMIWRVLGNITNCLINEVISKDDFFGVGVGLSLSLLL